MNFNVKVTPKEVNMLYQQEQAQIHWNQQIDRLLKNRPINAQNISNVLLILERVKPFSFVSDKIDNINKAMELITKEDLDSIYG
jgi:hypothetical protein